MGSKSTNKALGTCFPALVSLKNVLNASLATPTEVSLQGNGQKTEKLNTAKQVSYACTSEASHMLILPDACFTKELLLYADIFSPSFD